MILDTSKRTLIMGILNITPDSFYDGGKYNSTEEAIKHAKEMIDAGADIIDIGGESSRPGSKKISEEEELNRILEVVKTITKETDIPISIDTYKPKVAEECLKAGAKIINDITGLQNQEMIEVIKRHNAAVIIMHMQGNPETMQDNVQYENIIEEIKHFLKIQSAKAKSAGIKEIVLDPGIGFGKKLEHNLSLIKNLGEFKQLDYPILFGASRKSFIAMITGNEKQDRLPGTIAANTAAILNGADIIRVHDVKECKQAAMITDNIKSI